MSAKAHPPAVYSYTRFSTLEQRKGSGQRRQTSAAEAYCAERGWKLTHDYKDLGVSAFKGRNSTHGDLARFLAVVQAGRVQPGSVLIVESLDRLSRDNINKALELFLSIINAGVTVVTLVDRAEYRADTDPHTLMAQMMISLAIFLRANDESRTKSMRKAASWQYKREGARRGKYHGGKLPSWLTLDAAGKYKVIEAEANRVRAVFADYIAGEGLYVLARKYGLPAPTMAYWIDGKAVIGTLTVQDEGKPAEYAGHYPAIVDPTVWLTAQSKRRERTTSTVRTGPVHVNLFLGLLYMPNGQQARPRASTKDNDRCYMTDGLSFPMSAIEQHVCNDLLYGQLVAKRVETVEGGADVDRLAALEARIKQVQQAMNDDETIFADLLPVLKKVRAEYAELKKSVTRTTFERRDTDTLDNYLEGMGHEDAPEYHERRAALRELVRDTIARIEITSVLPHKRRRLLVGTLTLTNGRSLPMRFAIDAYRRGHVSCDGSGDNPRRNAMFAKGAAAKLLPVPQNATTWTPELHAELNKLPMRRTSDYARKVARAQSAA